MRDCSRPGRVRLNRERLLKLRQGQGLSQEQVADECRQQGFYVSVSSLKRAELEHHVLLRTAHNLARFYGVDVDDLITGESPEESRFSTGDSAIRTSPLSEGLCTPTSVSKKIIGLYLAGPVDLGELVAQEGHNVSIHYSSPSFHVLLLKTRHSYQKPTAYALSILREITRRTPDVITVIKPVQIEFSEADDKSQYQVRCPMTERLGIEHLAKQQPQGTVLVHHELFHCCHLEFNCTYKSNPAFAPGPWYSVTEYAVPELHTVGREQEHLFLTSLLSQLTTAGTGAWCNISGATGVGKTHMALTLAGEAPKKEVEHIILRHSCGYGDCGSGLHPGAELIRRLTNMGHVGGSQLHNLLEDSGIDSYWYPFIYHMFRIKHQAPLISDSVVSMSPYLFHKSCQQALEILLAAILGSRKLIVMIEEIHQLDDEMRQTLKALANVKERMPLLLITTSYSDFIAGFDRNDIKTVRLFPLTLSQSLELAQARGAGASEQWREQCVRRAQGNPLFLIELLHGEHLGDELPFNITHVVAARMATIPAQLKCALELISLSDDGFTQSQLEELLHAPLEQFAMLVSLDLLQPLGDRWFFTHTLLREAVYQSMPESVCRQRHAMLARSLRDKDPVQHAIHLARSGSEQALPELLAAAERLIGDRHYEQAEQLLALVEPLLQDDRDKHRAYQMQALVLHALGDTEQGINAALTAIDHCEDERDSVPNWRLLAKMYEKVGHSEDALHALNCAEILTQRYRQPEIQSEKETKGRDPTFDYMPKMEPDLRHIELRS